MGYLYVISNGNERKIGITENIVARLNTIQTANAAKLKVDFVIQCPNPRSLEVIIHEALEYYRMNGEWFKLTEDILITYISALLLLFPSANLIEYKQESVVPVKDDNHASIGITDEARLKDVLVQIVAAYKAGKSKEQTILEVLQIRKSGTSKRWKIADRLYTNVIARYEQNRKG